MAILLGIGTGKTSFVGLTQTTGGRILRTSKTLLTVRGQTLGAPRRIRSNLLSGMRLEPAVTLITAARGKYSYKCSGASPELRVQK
jgi:hypothetical protein